MLFHTSSLQPASDSQPSSARRVAQPQHPFPGQVFPAAVLVCGPDGLLCCGGGLLEALPGLPQPRLGLRQPFPEPGSLLRQGLGSGGGLAQLTGRAVSFRRAGAGGLGGPAGTAGPGTSGRATAPSRSTTSTPSAVSARSRHPLRTAAAAPSSAVAARRVCSTSVPTAALIFRP